MEGPQVEQVQSPTNFDCNICGKAAIDCECSRPNSVDPWIGKRINEQYEIVSFIARGGMGAVYKAKHLLLGTYKAIKIIRSDLHVDDVVYQRFYQEAKAVSALSHPGIVSFHDMGISDSIPYVLMDLLEGRSLDEEISKHGPMELKDALAIFVQVAEALSYAHSKGIFHRDIKPSNIMLVQENDKPASIRILDFGIAKINSQNNQKLTSTGEVFGSPAYMSPEQGRGGQIDERSDIYSLGCVMYETLMGNPPFRGASALETIMKHASEPAPPIVPLKKRENSSIFLNMTAWITQFRAAFFSDGGSDALFEDMKAIINRCLEKDPQKRYQSMSALATDLQRLNYGERLLYLQQEAARARALKLCTSAYNRLILLCLILLVPYAIMVTTLDNSSWEKEAEAAVRDPDDGYKTLQQLIVSQDEHDKESHMRNAYLYWMKGQVIRGQSTKEARGLEKAISNYKSCLQELDDFKNKGGVTYQLRAAAYEGLALSNLSLASLSSTAKAQAEQLRSIKDLNSPLLANNIYARALDSAITALLIRRQLLKNVLQQNRSVNLLRLVESPKTQALCLAQSLEIKADASAVLQNPVNCRAYLLEAHDLIQKYASDKSWLLADVLQRLALNSIHSGNLAEANNFHLRSKAQWAAIFGPDSDEVKNLDDKIKAELELRKQKTNTR